MLIALVLLGALVVGGIYAVVLIPIAAIILIGSLGITMWRHSRGTEARRGPAGSAVRPPSMSTSAGSGVNTPRAPDTPDEALKRRQG
jgi:hypothetical protein